MPTKVLDIEFRGKDAGVVAAMQAQGAEAEKTAQKFREVSQQTIAPKFDRGAMEQNAASVLKAESAIGASADRSAYQLRKLMSRANPMPGDLVAPPVSDRTLAAIRKMEQDTTNIRAAAEVDRLRLQGQELDAELLQIERNSLAKKAILERQLGNQLKAAPEDSRDALITAAASKRQAIEDAAAQARERAMAEHAGRQQVMERSNGDAVAEIFRQFEVEKTSISAEAQAQRLRLLGMDHQAELLMIDRNVEAKKAALDRELAASLKIAPDSQKENLLRAAAAKQQAIEDSAAEARARSAATAAERDRVDLEKREQTHRAYMGRTNQMISDLESEATGITAEQEAQRLRLLGNNLAAERVLIQHHAEEKRRLLEQDRAKALEQTPAENHESVNAAFNMKREAIDSSAQDAEARAVAEDKVAQARANSAEHARIEAMLDATDRQILEAQLNILRMKAQTGDKEAAAQLQAAVAAMEREAIEQVCLSVLESETATAEERLRAEQQITALKKAQAEQAEIAAAAATAAGKGGKSGSSIVSALGGRGIIGRGMELLAGGGILSMAGTVLTDATKNLQVLSAQFQAGTISTSEFTNGLIKATPGFGEVFKAGRTIAEFASSFKTFRDSSLGKTLGFNTLYANRQEEMKAAAQEVVTDYGLKYEKERAGNAYNREQKQEDFDRREIESNETGFGKDQDLRTLDSSRRLAELAHEHDERIAAERANAQASREILKKQLDDGIIDQQAYAEAVFQIDEKLSGPGGIERTIDSEYARWAQDEYNAWAAEDLRARREHDREVMEQLRTFTSTQRDAERRANMLSLEQTKGSLAAQVQAIKDAAQDKKNANEKQLFDDLRNASPDDAIKFRLQAIKAGKAIDKATAAEMQKVGSDYLKDEDLNILRQAAEAGDAVAKVRLEQAEATKKLVEQEKALRAIMQAGTPEQQAQAKKEMDDLQKTQRASLDLQLRKKGDDLQDQSLRDAVNDAHSPMQRQMAEADYKSFQIAQEFKKRAEADSALMQFRNGLREATPAQLKQLDDQIERSHQSLRDFAENAGNQDPNDTREHDQKRGFDPVERGLLLTGVAQAAGQQNDPETRQYRETQKTNELLQRLLEAYEGGLKDNTQGNVIERALASLSIFGDG